MISKKLKVFLSMRQSIISILRDFSFIISRTRLDFSMLALGLPDIQRPI